MADINFNPNHLMTFLSVVTSGSESRAAAELGIGQPAVSHQIKNLETALGQPLFLRQGRRMILTPAGNIARRYASQLASLCDDLMSDLAEETTLKGQTVRLGILDGIPKSLVVKLSSRLLGLAPNLRLQLSEGKGQYLLSELTHHQLDAIVLNTSPESQALHNLRAKKLGSLEVGAFGPEGMPMAPSVPIHDILRQFPLILPTYASRLRGECDRYFIENSIQPAARVEVEDTALQKLLALQGFGLALLPIEDGQEPALRLFGKLDGVYEDIWLVTHAPGKGTKADLDLWTAAEKLLTDKGS